MSLFPTKARQWLAGPGNKTLLVSDDGALVELRLRTGTGADDATARISKADYFATSINDFLRTRHLKRSDLSIGITLPAEQFFERRFSLPMQATSALDNVVTNDLLKKTPFKIADIYHSYTDTEKNGKIFIRQQLVQRHRVRMAASLLHLDVSNISFVESPDGEDPSLRKIVILRQERKRKWSWAQRVTALLLVSALMLALSASATLYLRQQSMLDELGAQISAAMRKAQDVRSTFDRLEHKHAILIRIHLKKSEGPTLLGVWDEMTRLLPDDSWLTELRLTEIPQSQDHKLTVVGLSEGAARLVEKVDESPLFQDATLTTAISPDPIERRERFSMQAMIRKIPHQGGTP